MPLTRVDRLNRASKLSIALRDLAEHRQAEMITVLLECSDLVIADLADAIQTITGERVLPPAEL